MGPYHNINKKRNEMKTTITDFERNPVLRVLTINYCKIHYEGAAELDDDHLMQEYQLLLKEGRLNDLFECEQLSNQ